MPRGCSRSQNLNGCVAQVHAEERPAVWTAAASSLSAHKAVQTQI